MFRYCFPYCFATVSLAVSLRDPLHSNLWESHMHVWLRHSIKQNMDLLMHYHERARTDETSTIFDSLFAMIVFFLIDIVRDILILTSRPIYWQLATIAFLVILIVF